MAATDELESLIKRINFEFDDWHNFYDHTKTVWRIFEQWVGDGNKLAGQNAATGLKYSEQDLALVYRVIDDDAADCIGHLLFSSTFSAVF